MTYNPESLSGKPAKWLINKQIIMNYRNTRIIWLLINDTGANTLNAWLHKEGQRHSGQSVNVNEVKLTAVQ
jgi:hypothetical protein